MGASVVPLEWPFPAGGSRAHRRVLVAIPEPVRAGPIAQAMQEVGFLPMMAFTRSQTLTCLNDEVFDVVILDHALARAEEQRFRESVGQRTAAALVILGEGLAPLDAGSDGFLYLPAHALPYEIAAIVQHAAQGTAPAGPGRLLHWGALLLDSATRQAWWHGTPLELTPLQFQILCVLVTAEGRLVTVKELSHRLWGSTPVDDTERLVAHIRRIRKRIEDDPGRPVFLLAVRGAGFRLAGRDSKPRHARVE